MGVAVAACAAEADCVELIATPNIRQTTKTRKNVVQTGFLKCNTDFVIAKFSSISEFRKTARGNVENFKTICVFFLTIVLVVDSIFIRRIMTVLNIIELI